MRLTPVIKNSKTARTSRTSWWDTLVATIALGLLSATALWYVYSHGYILYYGDAEAHLNHARRLFDSRTPGFGQLGAVWLPLPHLLIASLVMDDHLWQTGLA